MGESDQLSSEKASCPVFSEQEKEGHWDRSSGKRAVFCGFSLRERKSSSHPSYTILLEMQTKTGLKSKSVPAHPPLHASSLSVLDL